MILRVETQQEYANRIQKLKKTGSWRLTPGSRSKIYPNANSCGISPKRFARAEVRE